ncbi:hypothetical protein EJ04DRAFT_521814 [Polyplosphaeria fusca]|uniref:Uncharacterized protein n=1 Tax=Polyplosphaeria fusca TaxID=682080 RepID=A0A9P4R4C4_9PLEO|nr:hypothetical protein EJ04DRAFT_521814 [Polyplosphaeria fusca]
MAPRKKVTKSPKAQNNINTAKSGPTKAAVTKSRASQEAKKSKRTIKKVQNALLAHARSCKKLPKPALIQDGFMKGHMTLETEDPDVQARLHSLPGEIMNNIAQRVIGRNRVDVFCDQNDDMCIWATDMIGGNRETTFLGPIRNVHRRKPLNELAYLDRKMYEQFATWEFGHNIWVFHSFDALQRFSKSLLPHQRDAIETVMPASPELAYEIMLKNSKVWGEKFPGVREAMLQSPVQTWRLVLRSSLRHGAIIATLPLFCLITLTFPPGRKFRGEVPITFVGQDLINAMKSWEKPDLKVTLL